MSKRNRRGVALLEALIALAILGTAGLSVVAVVDATLRAQAMAVQRETTLATASRVLAAATLLTREEFDQRLGTRAVGEFVLDVQRPEKTLYRLGISEKAHPAAELLVTVVYRP
jgi:type II secretory pathway component PulJ